MRGLRERRLAFASKLVKGRFGSAQDTTFKDGDVALKRYRAFLRGVGLRLREQGLVALAAYCAAKKAEEKAVFSDLLAWFHAYGSCGSEVPASVVAGRSGQRDPMPAQFCLQCNDALLQRDSGELALLEASATAFFDSLKVVLEGKWRDVQRSQWRKRKEEVGDG
jgi:hypothetical protein